MGYGPAIFSGLLSGLSGLPRGMEQATQEDLARQQLGLGQQRVDLERQMQDRLMNQFQQGQFTDVPGAMLPSDYGSRVDPSTGLAHVQTTLLGPLLAARERQNQEERQAKQGSALALALGPLAAQDPSYKALIDALQTGVASDKIAPIFETINQHRLAQQQREQGRQLIAPLYKMLGLELPASPDATPASGPSGLPAPTVIPTGGAADVATTPGPGGIPRTLPLGQQPVVQDAGRALGRVLEGAAGLPGVTPSPAPAAPAPGPVSAYQPPTVTIDPVSGKLSFALHPNPPENPAAEYVKAVNEKQRLNAAGVPPKDPRQRIVDERLDYFKTFIVPAGGELRGVGTGLDQPTIPGRALAVGQPPIPTAAETTQAADAQTWIVQARDAANKLEDYLKSLTPAQRASFASRVKIQGWPIVGSMPGITSKQEQEITSAIGNLQLSWERATGGLRMASSPQMQERIKEIFGNPTNAATPQHLRTISDMMAQEINQRARTEAQGRRAPIAAPSGGMPERSSTAPPPASAPQAETLSRQDPRYQKARSLGMTDDQIQQKYGIVLVP